MIVMLLIRAESIRRLFCWKRYTVPFLFGDFDIKPLNTEVLVNIKVLSALWLIINVVCCQSTLLGPVKVVTLVPLRNPGILA